MEETDVQGLASNISDTEPRYSFFRYTHEVDGTEGSSIVFIYTCPAGSKVKERMVYASFKKLVMDAASAEGEFEVTKKVRTQIGSCKVFSGIIDADEELCSSRLQVLRRSRLRSLRRSFNLRWNKNRGSRGRRGRGKGNSGEAAAVWIDKFRQLEAMISPQDRRSAT